MTVESTVDLIAVDGIVTLNPPTDFVIVPAVIVTIYSKVPVLVTVQPPQ